MCYENILVKLGQIGRAGRKRLGRPWYSRLLRGLPGEELQVPVPYMGLGAPMRQGLGAPVSWVGSTQPSARPSAQLSAQPINGGRAFVVLVTLDGPSAT